MPPKEEATQKKKTRRENFTGREEDLMFRLYTTMLFFTDEFIDVGTGRILLKQQTTRSLKRYR